MTKDIDFVRLQLEPLAVTVQANARAWVKELGRQLNEAAKQDLMSLKTEMEVWALVYCVIQVLKAYGYTGSPSTDSHKTGRLLYCYTKRILTLQNLSNDLKRVPDTLEDLKFVLRVIASIRDMSLDVELRIKDILERYRTLLVYEIQVHMYVCTVDLGNQCT